MKTLKTRIKALSRPATGNVAIKRDKSRSARLRVLKRDGYLCQVCLANGLVTPAAEVDHIVPLHVGGHDSDENKQGICKYHHNLKSAAEGKLRRF